MAQDIGEFAPNLSTFGRKGYVVTPDDDNDLPNGPVKSLWVTAEGDLSFIPIDNVDDEVITIEGLTAGVIIPFIVRRVMETTTATIVAIDD
jgi:hypothetical protein